MAIFIVLGLIVFITFCVLGVLFYMLNKEGEKKETEKAVPAVNLDQLRSQLSTKLFEQSDTKTVEKDSEIIPVFESKVSLPSQDIVSVGEDEAYKQRAKELEDELRALSLKAEGQSDEAREMIHTLNKENESINNQKIALEKAQQKLDKLQQEASGLKVENVNLQTQLDSTNAKVVLLEEQMAAVKIQMGEEISRAHATVSELKREKEIFLATPKEDPDQSARQELEVLKSEHVQLKNKYEDLEKNNQQLQYELIKARAQSSGLERISFNYKNQIEELLKKNKAAPLDLEKASS